MGPPAMEKGFLPGRFHATEVVQEILEQPRFPFRADQDRVRASFEDLEAVDVEGPGQNGAIIAGIPDSIQRLGPRLAYGSRTPYTERTSAGRIRPVMNESLRAARTVLVRVPNWVGDIVMATPFFESLRRGLPGARIVACVRRYAAGILADGPWFDELVLCEDKSLEGFRETVRSLRRIRAQVALVLPNSWRAVLEPWLAGVEWIYGYRRGGRGILMSGGPTPLQDERGRVVPRPMVEYYLDLARWLGLEVPDRPRPRLYMSERVVEEGAFRMASWGIGPGDLVVGLNPGARFGSSKCWPAEYFAELAERLQQEFSCKILLLTGPGEEDLAEAICRRSRASLVNVGAGGVDLSLLKPLVKRCDLLVTNDTGPRHYAVAFGVPVVVVMGPTDPRYTNCNLEGTVVVRRDLPCSPCHLKTCPTDHACMRGITPSMVLEAARGLLAARTSA